MKLIYRLKCPLNHAIGNWIGSILSIIAALVPLLTFGFYYTHLEVWWIFNRDKFGLYSNNDEW